MDISTKTTISDNKNHVAMVTLSTASEQFGENHWNAWRVDYGVGFFAYPSGHVEFVRVCDSNLPKEKPYIQNCMINGKPVVYTLDTVFEVQSGKGKGSYKTRYTFKGNLGQAVKYYNGINIGNGYKKRLICMAFNKPILARQFS